MGTAQVSLHWHGRANGWRRELPLVLAARLALVVFDLCFPWPGPCTAPHPNCTEPPRRLQDGSGQHGSTLMAQVQLYPPSQPVRQRLREPDSILCLENTVGWTMLPVRDAEPRQGLGKGTLLSWKKFLSHCSRLGHSLLPETKGRPCAGRSSWFPSGPNSRRLLRKKEEKVRAALSPAHTSFGWAK